ncbi:hypothetical protein PT168_08555 [Erysipelothrix rhusiopathiae]|nr:hypothetical protein [Erysipelothrix rhusiopathiae]
MNIWIKKSIELANQRDYLDQLFKVYPMANNLKRELPDSTVTELTTAFKKMDNEKMITLLLEQELFPVKDSYVAYLRRDRTSIKRNPRTIDRLAGMIYEMGIEETMFNMTLPKETNRQIGPLFTNWLKRGSLGAKTTTSEKEFLEFNGNIIFEGGDNAMQQLATNHLGYRHNKGLDFIAKFNNKYVIGEAKFLTDFGGHQNAQLADALNVIRSEFDKTDKEVVKIAILDGVLYIPNQGKMHLGLYEADEDEVVISALLLRDYLYSL